MKDFILASKNRGKCEELKRMLEPMGINVMLAKDIGIELFDVDETGSTFTENAFLKAESAVKQTGYAAIADDSGMCVDALNGEPGVYSARYAGENATDSDRIKLVLEKMKDVPEGKRNAQYNCAICCLFPDGTKIEVLGECKGRLITEPRGNKGFGYDPIFVIDGYDVTCGEMESDEKDKISHRAKALQKFSEEIKKYI